MATTNIKKFEQLTCCPFCGNEEFYTTNWMQGSCDFNQRFDGEEPSDNSQMYDGLTVYSGKRAYCNACFKYLGNIESGTLSATTIQRLKEMDLYESDNIN